MKHWWCQILYCPIMPLFHPNKFSTRSSDQFIDMKNSNISPSHGITVDIIVIIVTDPDIGQL